MLGIPFSILFYIPVMILGIVCHLCCTVHWALPRLLETANDSDIDKLLNFKFRYRNNGAIAIGDSLLPSVQSLILKVMGGGGRFSARVRKPCLFSMHVVISSLF